MVQALSIERPRSLVDIVEERLRDAIVNAELAFGEAITEEGLGAAFGVSRTPLREALARLELQGLVVVVPKKGSFVFAPTQDDVTDLCQFRLMLEVQRAEAFAWRGTRTRRLRSMKAALRSDGSRRRARRPPELCARRTPHFTRHSSSIAAAGTWSMRTGRSSAASRRSARTSPSRSPASRSARSRSTRRWSRRSPPPTRASSKRSSTLTSPAPPPRMRHADDRLRRSPPPPAPPRTVVVIRLYYYPGNASLMPHILLEEIGAPFELALVDRAQRRAQVAGLPQAQSERPHPGARRRRPRAVRDRRDLPASRGHPSRAPRLAPALGTRAARALLQVARLVDEHAAGDADPLLLSATAWSTTATRRPRRRSRRTPKRGSATLLDQVDAQLASHGARVAAGRDVSAPSIR